MARDYDLGGPADHQRRPEYARDDEWIRAFLHSGRIAHIGSLWRDQPFVTPTTYYFDEPGNRLVFHSNVAGRLRANIERQPRLCAEISEMGRLLPSNVALEFSLQYRSVMVFGTARIITELAQQRQAMHQLISKYFGDLQNGKDYRPAAESELKRTSVFALQIESWSGKENWKQQADQSDQWPPLDKKWLA